MSSQNLYPVFKNPLLGSPRRDLPRHVAVVGAGTIGPDIGYYLKSALPDITLTLIDVREEALAAARTRLEGYAAKGVARGKMKEAVAARVTANIVTSTDYDALLGTVAGGAPPADLVIEAATEHIPLKKAIFAAIEERVTPDAVITSNTSSIPAARLFDELRFPGRTTVTHFFAPAWRNPAVEVVTWEKGDRAVVDYLRWLFAVTGKVPLVTADVVCFMLDRIFDNWCNESGYLLDRATAMQIDHVAEEFAAAGPFFVLDMSNGNPIIVETNTRQMEEGEAYRPALIFQSVKRWSVAAKPGTAVEAAPETRVAVRDRLLGILFSQALDIAARGIGTPEDLDMGCTLALAFKRGPLDMMTRMGTEETGRILGRLEQERPGLPGLGLLEHVPAHAGVQRYVLVDRMDDVAVLTIRRPAQLNALTEEVTDELLRALVSYEDDPTVTGFVIVGYGTRAFCAGADVGRFTDMLGDEAASVQYSRDCSRLLVHLDAMTKPVVAAVNGLALGGGAELAIRCHDRVASPRAYFQLPEVTLGIVPGIGGMVVPYRKWPAAASVWTDMILYAERLNAARALEIGMLSGVEEDYEALVLLAAERVRALVGALPQPEPDMTPLLDEVVEVGEPVARDGSVLSREVLEIAVAAIRAGIRASDLESALDAGYAAFGRVAATRAAAEGVGAFTSGRKPDFTGM